MELSREVVVVSENVGTLGLVLKDVEEFRVEAVVEEDLAEVVAV